MIRGKLIAASALLLSAPAFASGEPGGAPASSFGAATQTTEPPLTEAERAEAIKELEAMRARISALEQRLGVSSAAVQYTPAAEKRARDHNLELYGFTQLDTIQDFKRVDPDWEATLRPSKIPTTGGQFGSDGQSIFSVRQSRFGVKATGDLGSNPYEVKFEFDLFGTGANAGQTTFRLRHAYAKWGPFLAGQTNTLFMDGDIFPNVVDYWGPNGMVFVRNPQLRWTFLNRKGWEAAVALEHLTNDIDPGRLRLFDPDIAGNVRGDEKVPDLTAAIRYGGDWGHVRVAGLLRRVGYDTIGTDNNEPKGHKTGWGVNGTTAIKISLATLRLGAVYGRGIASYMNDGGMDLAPAVSTIIEPGNIILVPRAEAVKLFGLSAYVDLQWTKNLSSALGYSFDKVDNTNFQEPTAFHRGDYASANLLWTPLDNVLTGVEFLWGKRTDNDGNKGTDTRVQASFKWSFSSKNIWDLID